MISDNVTSVHVISLNPYKVVICWLTGNINRILIVGKNVFHYVKKIDYFEDLKRNKNAKAEPPGEKK